MRGNSTEVMPVTKDDTIPQQLDADFSMSMALVYVYVAMVIVTGLLGNLLVVVVYVSKFKANTTRSFIIALAVLGLVCCGVAMPLDLLDLSRTYTYPSDILCKVQVSSITFSHFFLALMLEVMALDRYRKICLPLASQLSVRGCTRAITGCCLLTIAVTWPQFVLAGQQQKILEKANVTEVLWQRAQTPSSTSVNCSPFSLGEHSPLWRCTHGSVGSCGSGRLGVETLDHHYLLRHSLLLQAFRTSRIRQKQASSDALRARTPKSVPVLCKIGREPTFHL